jgi:hypothetical protein
LGSKPPDRGAIFDSEQANQRTAGDGQLVPCTALARQLCNPSREIAMALFDYDYGDLARQVQHGLERIGVNFLRGHGALIGRDLVDFHGWEQVDLELSYGPHTLVVHQVGRPRGVDGAPIGELPAGLEEEFSSTFDGWPAANQPRDAIAVWLSSLPAGEARPPERKPLAEPENPFATERSKPRSDAAPEPGFNPFLQGPSRPSGANPIAESDRETKRREALRRLKED